MPFIVPAAAAIASAVGGAVAGVVGGAIGAFGALTGLNVIGAQFAAASFISSLAGASGLGAFVSSWSTVSLLASSALSPPQVGLGAAGTQVDFQADTNAGIPLVIGRTGTAGKIVHVMTTGAEHKNGHIAYKAVLSAGPIEGVEGFSANGVAITFAGDTAQTGKYLNQMWMRYDLGAKPQAANVPGGYEPGWTPEWTSEHKLSGLASAWWTMYFSPEAYPTGTPPPMWVVLGVGVYDPRQDSTYPGGAGPQRADDETTWSFEGRDNPYLQALTWCLGRRANGRLVHGAGVPAEAIDVAAFVYGANVAEANGWTVGGEVTSSDRKWEVLRALLQAGGGVPAFAGGRLTCVVRAPRVSLRTITGDDVIGPAKIHGTKPRRARFNAVVPRYRSEAHGWEMVPADPVVVDAYVTEDGGERRSREVPYPLVQDAAQAAQLAAYDIVDARELEPITLPLRPVYAGYRPGDCLTVDEPELGLNGQDVLIVGRELDLASGQVTFTCVSETADKHDFALGRTASPPPTPGLSGIDPSTVSTPDLGSWQAIGGVLEGEDGSAVPAIIITGQVNDPNVAMIIAEYRLVLDLDAGQYGDWISTENGPKSRRIEIRGLLPRTPYHVRIRYRTIRDVEGEQGLDLGVVTTGDLVATGVRDIGGLSPTELRDHLLDVVQQGRDLTAQGRELTARGMALAAQGRAMAKANLEGFLRLVEEREATLETTHVNGLPVRDILLDEVQQRIDGDGLLLNAQNLMGMVTPDGSAFQFHDTTLKVTPTQTWAQFKQSLQANFAANQAAIEQESYVRATQTEAIAQNFTSLSATVGQATSSIATLSQTVADQNSATSQTLSTLSSTLDQTRSSLTSLSQTVATQHTATAQVLTALEATIDQTVSSITALDQVVTTQNSAFAQQISDVSTTLNGNTAAVTQLSQSVNGLNAQYVLAVSAGNRVAGMRLAAGGGVSSIAFMADQIGFTNGAGTVYPLSVVDGVVRATNFEADRVKANSIVTGSIQAGNITDTTIANVAMNAQIADSWTLLGTMWFSSVGPIAVSVKGNISTNDSIGVALRYDLLSAGGGVVYSSPEWGDYIFGGNLGALNTVSIDEYISPGPGTFQIAIYGRRGGGGGVLINNRLLVAVTDFKTE